MDDHAKIEEIIREIAVKRGIAVSRDDPTLVLQTINNRLLLESAKAQRQILDQYKEELEALALRWGSDAKHKAERILNTSMSANREAMAHLMDETAKKTAATVAAEIDNALSNVDKPVRDPRRVARLACASGNKKTRLAGGSRSFQQWGCSGAIDEAHPSAITDFLA